MFSHLRHTWSVLVSPSDWLVYADGYSNFQLNFRTFCDLSGKLAPHPLNQSAKANRELVTCLLLEILLASCYVDPCSDRPL